MIPALLSNLSNMGMSGVDKNFIIKALSTRFGTK